LAELYVTWLLNGAEEARDDVLEEVRSEAWPGYWDGD